MTTSSRVVEITILSAEDLRMNGKPLTKKSFVSVGSSGPEPGPNNFRVTKMDTEGGSSYPSWKEKVVVDVPLHARFIIAEVKCKTFTGIKSVGTAKVPVSDFVGGYVPENQLHFLSYRLWDDRMRRNGILNISVRVKLPEYSPAVTVPAPVEGVPAPRVGGNGSLVVATGIPIWL